MAASAGKQLRQAGHQKQAGDSAAGKNETARIALHTVIPAALAKAQGSNATAGALGGFIASAGAEQFAQALYSKDADQLNPDEKMVILNLVSAVGAVGGGVATGNTNGMVSAGNAARVEVENNSLVWLFRGQNWHSKDA
ncbi:VENN motif pre-toxin domain-containing protein [Kosakonia sp. BK9b]